MFVRWKTRKRKRRFLSGYTRYAYLVECKRIDGEPRQKVIAYLGSIRDYGMDKTQHQFGLWDTADAALDGLALDTEARQEIEAKLLETVPRPSPARYAVRDAMRAALKDNPGMALSERIATYNRLLCSAQESAPTALPWALPRPEPAGG